MVSIDRYIRNHNSITREEGQILRQSKVCVVGCGGLGGHIIEMLGRLGVGSITAIDGDRFDETNLNRQILSNEKNIGESKSLAAKERMEIVNSAIEIMAIEDYINEFNGKELLKGHHIVVDALDNIPSRLLIQKLCNDLDIPLIHGAIAGWYGQVTTVYPGDFTLDKIYREDNSKGSEKELGNPSFIPSLISSIQVAELVKVLLNKGKTLRGKLLFIDLLDQDYNIIEL